MPWAGIRYYKDHQVIMDILYPNKKFSKNGNIVQVGRNTNAKNQLNSNHQGNWNRSEHGNNCEGNS